MTVRVVEHVPIERLSFNLSPRWESCDANHVAALGEVLAHVPPIVVHSSTMQVIDGVHRVMAMRQAGRVTVPAVMFDGDDTAAQIEAVRSNVAHGKPLSLAEREAAAVRIIELVRTWSDRRIATVVGLSAKTIARLRHRATADLARLRGRVGLDGRTRPVDPAESRRQVRQALQDDPEASSREIARRTGASQGTVRDVRKRLRRGLPAELPAPTRTTPVNGTPVVRDSGAGEHEPNGSGPLRSLPDEFAEWFARSGIQETDWRQFVNRIPLGCVYQLADACRQRSESWRQLAVALEDRVRDRRRS